MQFIYFFDGTGYKLTLYWRSLISRLDCNLLIFSNLLVLLTNCINNINPPIIDGNEKLGNEKIDLILLNHKI